MGFFVEEKTPNREYCHGEFSGKEAEAMLR